MKSKNCQKVVLKALGHILYGSNFIASDVIGHVNQTSISMSVISKCQLENICDIQFTEYHANKGGHYDWHIDVNWNGNEARDRKLSVTVQLSDTSEYEGGGFEFIECQTPDASSRLKGTVLVFPSYLQHRVLPITSGTRKSLVAWFEGPRWQ